MPRAIAASSPPRMRKKPSGVRSPVRKGRSRSSTSLVMRCAPFGVRARHDERRDAASRRRPAARPRACGWNGRRRDQHLAAHVAALLLRRELVLEMDAGGSRPRSWPSSARTRSAARRSPPRRRPRSARTSDGRSSPSALWIWSARWSVWLMRLTTRRHAVHGIQALVRIHLPREVRVGGDLPAARDRSPSDPP